MHVLVRIRVVQRQTGCRECCELCPDFRTQLAAKARPEEVVDPKRKLVGWKLPRVIDQIGDVAWRQDGRPLDCHQMQSHPQPRHPPRSAHRIGGGRGGDHQAGGLQDSIAVGAFDPFIDGFGQAEIIGGIGDGFHCLAARSIVIARQ